MSNQTILYIGSSRSGYERWKDALRGTQVATRRATDLSLSLVQHDYDEVDLIVVEATGNIDDDADQCLRLRSQVDVPILLVGSHLSEHGSVAAYEAGADECVMCAVSDALIRAKVVAWLRWSRPTPGESLGRSDNFYEESSNSRS